MQLRTHVLSAERGARGEYVGREGGGKVKRGGKSQIMCRETKVEDGTFYELQPSVHAQLADERTDSSGENQRRDACVRHAQDVERAERSRGDTCEALQLRRFIRPIANYVLIMY